MKRLALVFAACSALLGTPAFAAPLADCPSRDLPFSSASPLIDILMNDQAKAALEKVRPGMFNGMPPIFSSTTPPSFAAILTLKEMNGFAGGNLDLDAMNRALAPVPVTQADKVARCARYDTEPLRLAIPKGKPRLLLFEKINGFKDTPSVNGAHAAFLDIAARKGWIVVTTEKGSAFTPAILKQFDAVIWNNISGDVLTLSQRKAFEGYMKAGGGFVGVHGTAGDPVYFWDWYVDGLLGARFAGHPRAKQFQTATVKIDDTSHPVAKGLPATWEMNDEWYSFKNNPRASGSHIIATLDETTYEPTMMKPRDLAMTDHPIAWTRCVGKGRMFYSAIGHRPERYADALYVKMLEQGISYAAGAGGGRCPAKK